MGGPENKTRKKTEVQSNISFRETCDQPTDKWYTTINNVRAILTNGGDVWTENSTGRYVVLSEKILKMKLHHFTLVLYGLEEEIRQTI
ncbi:MAG: hypothetical protein R2771_02985 [Saprospiraceae bacterium]